MNTHEFENGAFRKRFVLSVNAKNGDIQKRFTFLCQAITIAFKVAIGAFLTDINKRLCFEKGLTAHLAGAM